jgi:hypothetical protein
LDAKASTAAAFDRLDGRQLATRLERLEADISASFPDRGLVKVTHRMVEVAREAENGVAEATRPNLGLRFLLVVLVGAIIAAPVALAGYAGFRLAPVNGMTVTFVDLLQAVDGLFNVVFLGLAGVVFVTTIEERIKRRRALSELHRIRSLTHVIDMHQLDKDPGKAPSAELRAYLGHCADLMSLAAKLAALYAQDTRDAVVIETVNDIETLANNLSRKIWQKIALAGPPGSD